jgi:hypothetical protein
MLYHATLSALDNTTIIVHLPARSEYPKRMARVKGSEYDPATLRWRLPLTSVGDLLAEFGSVIRYDRAIFSALTPAQMETLRKQRALP